MKKLGAFGCSYTNYRGVTYADLLSSEFDLYYNGGAGGGGNRLIFNRTVEYLQENSFNSDDLLVVQWSSLTRFDFYNNGTSTWFPKHNWITGGTVFHNGEISQEFRQRYFSMFLQIRELCNYIDTIVAFSKVKQVKVVMCYMLEPWFAHFFGEPGEDNETTFKWRKLVKDYKPFLRLQELYQSELFISPSIEQVALDNPKEIETLYTPAYKDVRPDPVTDYHPSAFQHLLYTSKIAKHVGIELDYANLKSIAHTVNELQVTPYGDEKLMHDVGIDLGFEEIIKPNKYFDKYVRD